MPTYEYKCEACGFKFEKFQSMSAKPIRKCPHCGKNRVKRLIGTGAGLIFKGSGFYITDYRSEGYKKDAKSDQPAGASSSSTTESKGSGESKSAESKPAAAETKKPAAEKTPAKSEPPAKPSKKKE